MEETRVFPRVHPHCNTPATYCNTLHSAVCCRSLPSSPPSLQHTCNILQHTAFCSVLQVSSLESTVVSSLQRRVVEMRRQPCLAGLFCILATNSRALLEESEALLFVQYRMVERHRPYPAGLFCKPDTHYRDLLKECEALLFMCFVYVIYGGDVLHCSVLHRLLQCGLFCLCDIWWRRHIQGRILHALQQTMQHTATNDATHCNATHTNDAAHCDKLHHVGWR